MKRRFLKVLSVLLVFILLATSLPFTTLASEENVEDDYSVSTDMGDMSVTATNSFGEMLTESLSEQTYEQNGGYYISDIEYEGYCALVTFVTKQNCKIRVSVYEEDTGRMITSASIDVLAEDIEAIVEFEDELPDYFVLKAFMLDEGDAPLCKPYTCNEMTQMYEEFMATTVDDFDEDKVINLDESEVNNFLVMSDEISTITTDSETNVLTSYDEETGIYTFENIDEQITSLQSGDIFYFDNGNVEELTFIKVSTIEIEGTTAEITETEATLEETFDIVKIDSEMTSGDFVVDEDDELADGITYDGVEEIEESGEVSIYAWESEKDITFQHNYTLSAEIEPSQPKKIGKQSSLSGSIKISGNTGISVTGKFKYYISRKFSEVEFTLTPSIAINVSVEGVGRLEVKLKALDFSPCAGVYIGISPKFIVEASVKASFNATLKFTLGVGYNTIDGLVNKSQNPSFKPEFKIEGEIFVGVDLSPRAYIASEKVAKVELGSEIGALLTATMSTSNGASHQCSSCLDGDIDLVGDLTGKLVFGEKTKWEKSLNIDFLNIKIDIIGFYYSFTYDKFGWGTCPYNKSSGASSGSSSGNTTYVDCHDIYRTYSGSCGSNVRYLFDEATGTLTISGTGEMENYSNVNLGIGRNMHFYSEDINKIIIKNGVTSIGDYAFANCVNLTSISLPNSIETIGKMSFYNCESLTKITIPSKVTTIKDYALEKCSRLRNIDVPDSVTSLGENVFASCDGLVNVVLGDGITAVEDWMFAKCSSLKTVKLGKNIKSIGEYAFVWCDNLISVELGNNIKTIGKSAFSWCSNLPNITIPDSVTIIGNYAFYDCKSLKSINFPESVTTIGNMTFYNCDKLTNVYIHENISSIGVGAFRGCDSLTSIDVDEDNLNYSNDEHGVLFNKDKTQLMQCPGGIAETIYVIPNGTLTLDYGSFHSCCDNITSLYFPMSVTVINSIPFGPKGQGWDTPIDVYYAGTEEEWKAIDGYFTCMNMHYETSYSDEITYSYNKPSNVEMTTFNSDNVSTSFVATASNTVKDYEYVLLVIRKSADIYNYSDEDVLYIDQKTAEENGEISFAYIPKENDGKRVYIIGFYSDTDSTYRELYHECIGTQEVQEEPTYTSTGSAIVTCGECVVTFLDIIPVKTMVCSLSNQIRFDRNADGSYAGTFDVRTRAMISDEAFKEVIGATNEEAVENIDKVGFVYTLDGENFSATSAQAVAQGGTVTGYVDAPVKYIQDADGYYMFTCLVTDIPETDKNYTLTAYAYICVNGKWYFSEEPMNADFNSLYTTYYPVAAEKYGWEV